MRIERDLHYRNGEIILSKGGKAKVEGHIHWRYGYWTADNTVYYGQPNSRGVLEGTNWLLYVHEVL